MSPISHYPVLWYLSDWSTLVVGKISPWIDLDSNDEATRKNSEKVSVSANLVKTQKGLYFHSSLCFVFQAIHQEISYAIHLSLPAILIPAKSHNCYNLARTINCLAINSHIQQVRCSASYDCLLLLFVHK